MTRIALDLDPRILTKLRALANRRGVTIDVIADELLAAGLRTPSGRKPSTGPMASTGSTATPTQDRSNFGLIDVEYPEEE